MITAEQRKHIKGFQVVVLNGKELPQHEAIPEGAVRKINGPHTDAKWAKHLLGTDLTASQRKNAIETQRADEAVKKLFAPVPPAPKPKRKVSPLLAAMLLGAALSHR